LRPDAIDALKTKLLPLATVITPNLHEARALTGMEIRSLDEMREAAKKLSEFGVKYVVVKGGHLEGTTESVDILYDGKEFTEFRAPRYETKNTHGTGCIFASAIAAGLAFGLDIKSAVKQAKEFITAAIKGALSLGKGHGPANPMAWLSGGD
ncbi:MAG: PfkB family carbohydrate kinase, partial [Armatimonadetes bacterium]|nr:PfkB family carbohydrate kinase [Armatimonadota bacterium]